MPSSGELWLIYQHLEEIQNALSIVGGQRFVTVRGEDTPVYWSSTEDSAMYASATSDGVIRLAIDTRFVQFLISIYLN